VELTAPEFAMMQSHAALGREILNQTPGVPETAIIITAQPIITSATTAPATRTT